VRKIKRTIGISHNKQHAHRKLRCAAANLESRSLTIAAFAIYACALFVGHISAIAYTVGLNLLLSKLYFDRIEKEKRVGSFSRRQ
jgi:hypothetical protein